MYRIQNNTYQFTTLSSLHYAAHTILVPSPYVCELFPARKNEYIRLVTELNTTSQHLLIEIDRMADLNRSLTPEEHQALMDLYDRQIAAQAALQRHLHALYDGTEYIG